MAARRQVNIHLRCVCLYFRNNIFYNLSKDFLYIQKWFRFFMINVGVIINFFFININDKVSKLGSIMLHCVYLWRIEKNVWITFCQTTWHNFIFVRYNIQWKPPIIRKSIVIFLVLSEHTSYNSTSTVGNSFIVYNKDAAGIYICTA